MMNAALGHIHEELMRIWWNDAAVLKSQAEIVQKGFN